MALVWNTKQLLSNELKERGVTGTPVEYHFLSYRRLYDSSIVTVDKDHSSAGEWVAVGDHHWYTLAVITHPTYALPQELCLSFDCFSRTETMGNATSSGPPIEPVAIELGAIISLLAREPIIPLGVRRVDGKPVKWDNSAARVLRPISSAPLPEAGINSDELRAMVEGLAQGALENAEAILAAAKLYHAALTLSGYDISTAYFSLVAAIECIAGHHLKDQVFEFDAVEKFKKSGAVIDQISPLIPDSELPRQLKEELLRGEHFIGQKFRAFIDAFLTEDFWLPDKLYPNGYAMSVIEKSALKKHLREIYDARSKFAHAGRPFPDYVANGVSDRVGTRAMLQTLGLHMQGTAFIPAFLWFERLTHTVLVEYLRRIIAPELGAARSAGQDAKTAVLKTIANLPETARASLKKLLDWSGRFLAYAVMGPMASNREWATDEAAIECLRSAGLIDADAVSMDGKSWIKDREVAEIAGEFFYGAAQNPFRDNTLFGPPAAQRMTEKGVSTE